MQGGVYMVLFRFIPFPVLMLLPFISQDVRNAVHGLEVWPF